jgi:hypothetical protein
MIRAALSAFAFCFAAPAFAQVADIPGTTDGRPDFQGVWESRWRTPLERPQEAEGPIVAPEKADALVAAMEARYFKESLNPESDFDWGPLMPAPGGGFRTSLIVEPADGKLPLTTAAQEWAKTFKADRDRAEGPEARNLWERCIRGPGGSAPLAITHINMNRLFVQTNDHLVINTEDMAEARIIELAVGNRPAALLSHMGESKGRWEGDALVIETGLLLPDPASSPPSAPQAKRKITERLQFNSPDELAYSYVLNDPGQLTAPVRVEFILVRSSSRMFEASCHEGNYSMTGILRGARFIEQQATGKGAP